MAANTTASSLPQVPRTAADSGAGRRVAAAACLLVQAVILYAPSAPRAPKAGGMDRIPVDKVIHFLAFAAPTATLVRAGMPGRVAGTLMAAHALASEVIQHHLFAQRSGEVGDAVADLAGVAVGLGTAAIWK